jgi:hypothetical protein
MAADVQALIAVGDVRKAELIEIAGGLCLLSEVTSLLKVPEELIEEQRKAGTIIAIRAGADWMRLEWLLVQDNALEGPSPLEALRAGRIEEVVDVVRGQGAERCSAGAPPLCCSDARRRSNDLSADL